MGIFQFKKSEYTNHIIYLVKCLLGVIICYVLYATLPQYPFYWAIVSVVVAMSQDGSNTQAIDRMKANVLGCVVGICIYPLQLPEILLLCIGVILTIIFGVGFKITSTLRSALAALVIIVIQGELTKHWYVALERVFCVVIGCLVALLLTVLFNWGKPPLNLPRKGRL